MRFSICVIEPEGTKYSHFLYDICKYFCYGIESAGYECCILRNNLSSDRVNIIVGAHNQTDPAIVEQIKSAGKYILLQSEIITGDSLNNWSVQKSFADVYLPLMRQAQAVWDGFESNIRALKKLDVEADLIRGVLGYHPLMEEIRHKRHKDIDFLFYGSVTPHRRNLLNALIARGSKVVAMFDDAEMYRNDLIARTRVNLAPNQGPGMNHLTCRVMYLVNNHSIVVVERCYNQGMYEHCFPFADTEQWVDLCMETLHRPDLAQITEEYYERFKKIRMVDIIEPLLEKFLSKLKSSSPVATSIKKDCQMELVRTGNAENPLNSQLRGQACIFQNDAAKEIPSLIHPEFIEGMTSIIILTQNRLDQTKKCVKSIRKHTPETHEIIFVDNASTDETVKWLQSQVKINKNYFLIENKENVGLAKGRNQGINLSQGEFILLMDNDVIVSEGWLSGMLECLNCSPIAGIIGPMTNNIKGLQQVTDESYQSVNHLDQYVAKFKERFHHRRIPCRNIAGFCMLFKRTLVERIGLLDECFDVGQFEDEDFCWRSALEGYQNYIAGDVFIHHHESKESPGDRKILDKKWTLSMDSPEGKKLAVLKAMESADILYSKRETDQAVEALINCITFTPDAKEIYYELSRIFLESKKFSEALEVVESMPEAVKNDMKGLEYAGYAKEGLGLNDEAAAYADRMLSIDKNYPAALNLKGVLAYKRGDKEKAADFFRRALVSDPGYGEAYTNLGVLCWSIDNKDEALAHLRKGFVLSPTVPDASSLYYSVVSSLGTHRDAEDVFREACRLYPNHKSLAFLLIDIFIQQEKFESALIKIEDALALFGLEEGILAAALSVREKLGPRDPGEKCSKKATLSVCMIVKNEEEHLVKCLKSVRDIVDEMVVVDTGSTDRTKDIATVFGAKVFEFPWTEDFSAARNHSLSKAQGDWIMVLDADEVLSFQDHARLKKLLGRKDKIAYDFITRNYVNKTAGDGWVWNDNTYIHEQAGRGWYPSNKVRLFPNNEKIRFEQPIHELVEYSLQRISMDWRESGIPVHHYGALDAKRATAKYAQLYELAVQKMRESGGDFRSVWELAVHAGELNKYEESIELWHKALDFKPHETAAYSNLANQYLHLGKYEDYCACASKAYALDSLDHSAVLNYGMSEFLVGDINKTISTLEGFLKDTDSQISHVGLLAVSCLLTGQKDRGLKYLQSMVNKKYNCKHYFKDLAQSLIAAGNLTRAKSLLTTAIEIKFSDQETSALLDECERMPAIKPRF